jgi:uncharacterized membrane protein HdeD (DUF308 family)
MSDNPAGGWPPQETTLSALSRSWWLILTVAVLAIVLGVLMLANVDGTLKVVAFLVGLQFLVVGIVSVIRAFATKEIDGGQRVLFGILGVLGIIAGVIAMKNPGLTVGVLAILLGALWLVQGIIEFFGSLGDPGLPDRGWRIFGGLITAIAGAIILFWPAPSVAVLAWVAGLWLVIYGVIGVFAAFKVRRMSVELVPGPGGPSIRL